MADKKISQLTSATTPLAGTEDLPIVQSGATVKTTVAGVTKDRTGISVGKALNSWRTTSPDYVVQVGDTAAVFSDSNVTLDLGNNWYLNSSNQYIRNITNGATRVQCYQGNYKFFTAASGSAGTQITWRQDFTITQSSGDVTVNTGNLVQGTAAKGVTTGGSFALGLGTNGSTSQATLNTDGNLNIATTGKGVTGDGGAFLQAYGLVAAAGYIDLSINANGFAGILSVSATRGNYNPQSTRTVFAATCYGTTLTTTSLHTQDGSGGSNSFSVTCPSAGVVRITDTSGYGSTTAIYVTFHGAFNYLYA